MVEGTSLVMNAPFGTEYFEIMRTQYERKFCCVKYGIFCISLGSNYVEIPADVGALRM
jgi:hypothetical protein